MGTVKSHFKTTPLRLNKSEDQSKLKLVYG